MEAGTYGSRNLWKYQGAFFQKDHKGRKKSKVLT